jgi:hypothetical protein
MQTAIGKQYITPRAGLFFFGGGVENGLYRLMQCINPMGAIFSFLASDW